MFLFGRVAGEDGDEDRFEDAVAPEDAVEEGVGFGGGEPVERDRQDALDEAAAAEALAAVGAGLGGVVLCGDERAEVSVSGGGPGLAEDDGADLDVAVLAGRRSVLPS